MPSLSCAGALLETPEKGLGGRSLFCLGCDMCCVSRQPDLLCALVLQPDSTIQRLLLFPCCLDPDSSEWKGSKRGAWVIKMGRVRSVTPGAGLSSSLISKPTCSHIHQGTSSSLCVASPRAQILLPEARGGWEQQGQQTNRAQPPPKSIAMAFQQCRRVFTLTQGAVALKVLDWFKCGLTTELKACFGGERNLPGKWRDPFYYSSTICLSSYYKQLLIRLPRCLEVSVDWF